MAMVDVVSVAAYRQIYWLKLIGLVQRSASTWRSCYSVWPKVCHNGGGAKIRFLPVKFKHRKQHYFNKCAYLVFLNFVINPFCAITEQIRRRMNA